MAKELEKTSKKFGLIGKNISYSFSKTFFTERFKKKGLINHTYQNFDLQDLSEFNRIIKNNPNLKGLNVTIPYKEQIITHLDDVHKTARSIGAVNTIKFEKKGLVGYNTDHYGFKKSIKPFLKKHHKKALVLGTGGASKAVIYALEKMNIECLMVSRASRNDKKYLNYNDLEENLMNHFTIIINCTPLGTSPKIYEKPDIPYQFIGKKHLLFDLVYNPEETTFLKLGSERGAVGINGIKMLEFQAKKAWKIWNS